MSEFLYCIVSIYHIYFEISTFKHKSIKYFSTFIFNDCQNFIFDDMIAKIIQIDCKYIDNIFFLTKDCIYTF